MRMGFRFDGRMEWYVIRDGSIVRYFLSRDVDVGITCDEVDSWESWDRTSHLILPDLISIIMNAVSKDERRIRLLGCWVRPFTTPCSLHYTITRQGPRPRLYRLTINRHFHFIHKGCIIFSFLSYPFSRKFEPNLSYYARHYIAQLSTYNTSPAMPWLKHQEKEQKTKCKSKKGIANLTQGSNGKKKT